MTPHDLRHLFERVSEDLDDFAAPWAVIGSGALILAGAPLEEASDLDVVCGVDGAQRLRAVWAEWRLPDDDKAPDGPFRSEDFSRYATPWGQVEVMGGLRVRGRALQLSRPIPPAEELLAILRLFGRPKDLEKAAVVEAWLSAG